MHFFITSKLRQRHAYVDDVTSKRFCVSRCLMHNSYPIFNFSLPLDSQRSGARPSNIDVDVMRGVHAYVDDVT